MVTIIEDGIRKAQTMSDDKSGSPPCGIYVRIDNFSDMPKLITDLRQMAMVINRASGYEENMSVVELVCNDDNLEQVGDLTAILQVQGLVVILSGAFDITDIMGTDGVLVEQIDDIAKMRTALGDDAIIGVKCSSRTQAEQAVSEPIDYVVLPADPALIGWWSTKTEGLSVVSGQGITNHSCGGFVRAGASFIDVTDYIFTYEKGVMQGTVNILYAIDTAVQTIGKLH